MQRNVPLITQQRLIVFSLVLVTFGMTPGLTFDPFNIVKFMVLVILATSLLLVNLPNLKISFTTIRYKRNLLFCALYITATAVWIFGETPSIHQFYGVEGRYTGFLFVFSCLMLMQISINLYKENFSKRILEALWISSGLTSTYGTFQFLGFNPFNLANEANPIIATFGNPNFVSAFLGFASLSAAPSIFSISVSRIQRLALTGLVVFNMTVIYLSNSIQGLIIFLFVLNLYIYTLVKTKFKKYNLTKYLTPFVLLPSIFVILDITQRMPWKSYFYKESFGIRWELWKIGWKIGSNHLLNGIGFDGYVFWFRKYVDEPIFDKYEFSLLSNSSHNFFIDQFANGGLFYVTLFVMLFGYITFKGIKLLQMNYAENFYLKSIVLCWLGFLAQTFISPTNIAIASWGFVFGGLVLGGVAASKQSGDEIKEIKTPAKKLKKNEISANKRIGVGILVGYLLSSPIYRTDASFYELIETRDANKSVAVSSKWPQSYLRSNRIAKILDASALKKEAFVVCNQAVTAFPANFECLVYLVDSKELSKDKEVEFRNRLKNLAPLQF
jgi:hypothetical protein